MTVESIVYDAEGLTTYDDPAEAKAAQGTTWVRVHEAGEGELEAVADVFDVHPLAVEDVNNGVRPKAEEFPQFTSVLVKTAELARGETTFEEEIHEEPIGVFFGDDWIVSMATGDDEPVGRVWAAVERGDARLLQRGPDFTAYRLIDVIVDEYFGLLDRIEDQIEAIAEAVLVSTEIETVEAINGVRRDLLSFRRIAWPMREAVGVVARGDAEHVREPTEKYFRDVYDHLVQVVELTEIYRDLAAGARDIYLNTVSQSTNEVMKALTVVATIFLPLTFVVGIYGMNFEGGPWNMPELGWEFGYPAVMLGMALVAVLLLWFFRERGFL
jgi:magnesium transporter